MSGYLGAVLAGLTASMMVRAVVEHPRPTGGALSGGIDAFPSGHILQATIIAGLVPVAVAVVAGTKNVIRPLRLVLAVVVAMGAVERVGTELDWPTDVLGGALAGLALVLAVERVLATERSHARCHGCPWRPGEEPSCSRGGGAPRGRRSGAPCGWPPT